MHNEQSYEDLQNAALRETVKEEKGPAHPGTFTHVQQTHRKQNGMKIETLEISRKTCTSIVCCALDTPTNQKLHASKSTLHLHTLPQIVSLFPTEAPWSPYRPRQRRTDVAIRNVRRRAQIQPQLQTKR
jgi:hypothetical protein